MKTDKKIYHFLVIEDNSGDFAIVEDYLSEQFVEPTITRTTSFKQTKFILSSAYNKFDVVLLDLSLPDKAGAELLKEMLQLNILSPIIILTGYSDIEFSMNSIANGISDYLIKDDLNAILLRKSIIYSINRQKASETLLQNEARLREAQGVAKIGCWEADLINLKVEPSEELYRIYRIDAHAFPSAPDECLELVHPKDRTKVKKAFIESLDNASSNVVEHRIVTPSGHIKFVEERWKVIYDSNKQPVRILGTCQDVTERQIAEQSVLQKNKQLKNLTFHLQQVREQERSNIAREIHDELGQQLTALKRDIEWVQHKQNNPAPVLTEKLNEMLSLSDALIQTIRRISSDLRPSIIDDLGLVEALAWKCNEFEKQMGVSCTFSKNINDKSFDGNVSINVYRILQESLTNIIRHAQAECVQVSLTESQNELILEITDDGIGINSTSFQKETFGIVGMKERASMLGGELIIEGHANKGTLTRLTLPLKNEHTNS